jgi:hypothetical protein
MLLNRFVLLAGLLGLVALLVFSSFPLPYTIEGTGRVYAAREWTLVRARDGALQTHLRDHLSGAVVAYDAAQIERGDAVRFALSPRLRSASTVLTGDTIGVFESSETTLRLAELTGDLETAMASLVAVSSGDKGSVITEAERRLQYAQEQLLQQQRVVDRLAPQHQSGYIAASEYELQTSALRMYEVGVSIAEAQLESALSGSRPEDIGLVRSRIVALQGQIGALRERSSRHTVRAPFEGRLRRSYSPDTLIVLRDHSSLVALVPIPFEERAFVTEGQQVSLVPVGTRASAGGVVIQVDDAVLLINGRQVILVAIHVNGENEALLPGSLARARIEAEAIPLREYARRFFRSLVV